MGIPTFDEVLNLASVGDVVLTERVDSMYRADGTKIMEFRLMGAIELLEPEPRSDPDPVPAESRGARP